LQDTPLCEIFSLKKVLKTFVDKKKLFYLAVQKNGIVICKL